MKAILLLTLVLGLLIAGCVTPPPTGNNTIPPGSNNTTVVPPGYEVRDYCEKDSDCVRLNKCCDCGLGEYVNGYHQESPDCTGPQCLCPMALSRGACQNSRCVAVPVTEPPSGFCGWSTNGSCSTDSDCVSGGCSGQVCQSRFEEPVITTCEYTDCYNAESFGVSCGCTAGKCQWR